MKATTKRKAAPGTNQSSKSFNNIEKFSTFSVFNNNKKRTETQRKCSACGDDIQRDLVVFNNATLCGRCEKAESAFETAISSIVTTPKTVIRCFPCRGCKKPFSLQKLNSSLMVCRDCLHVAQSETPTKRNRIFSEILNNYAVALRRQISFGGKV